MTAYEKFLANVPAKMKRRATRQKRVEAIKAMPGKVHVPETDAPVAQITVDVATNPTQRRTTSRRPWTSSFRPDITRSRSSLRLRDHRQRGRRHLASKQDVKVDLGEKPRAVPPPAPPVCLRHSSAGAAASASAAEPRSNVPAYVTGAVAIVATGVGIGFGAKALSQVERPSTRIRRPRRPTTARTTRSSPT